MNALDRLTARPASAEDDEFRFQLYAASRADEIAAFGWPAAQQDAFLRMQYSMRRQSYAAGYPGARHSVLLLGGVPAGAAIVYRTQSEMRLIDIALLAGFRNRGMGGKWIAELIAEARSATLPLRLSVFHGNPARHLYERLGFVPRDEGPMYIEMENNGLEPR
jgi:GNAT superfamily N-acetyltransferase